MTKLKKTVIIFLILILACVGFALIYNDMVSFDNPKYYKQALAFYSDGDYQNAYYNFSKVKKISPLYKITIFKQADCADKLGDYATAIEKYRKFVKKYPKSILTDRANYNLAKAYFFDKEFEAAKKEFESLKKFCSKKDYQIASNYYLGLIEKENENYGSAKEYFMEYIKQEPRGTYSLIIAEELASLELDLESDENLLIGKIYFYNKEYRSAKKYLNKAEFKDSWSYLTVCYEKQLYYPKARKIFKEGFSKYSRSVDLDSLHGAIDSFIRMKYGSKKQGWFDLSKMIQENKCAGEDYVLFKLSKYLTPPYNLALYSRIMEKYPNTDFAVFSNWYLFWNAYKARDYDKAKKIGEEFLKEYSDSILMPKMLYWMSKLSLKQHKNSEAHGYLNKILNKYPDDFYAYRADSMAKSLNDEWGLHSHHDIDKREFNIELPINYADLDIKDLKLINTLLDLGDYAVFDDITFDNKFVQSWFEYKRGNKRKSTLLAREGLKELKIKPPFNDDVYKLAYPIYWGTEINYYSENLNIDPYLIIALMREESYFDSNSKSVSGARGLMQLMPATASYVARKYGIDYRSRNDLYNAKKNIQLGCTYFKDIKSDLNGNNLFAVAGYNGGPNSVKKWQTKLKYSDFDEFIENIPYPETQNYVKKIYKSYWNYLNIYNY